MFRLRFVILDARSTERYQQLHVRGAISLPFPDIAVATLQQTLPDREARILIYWPLIDVRATRIAFEPVTKR